MLVQFHSLLGFNLYLQTSGSGCRPQSEIDEMAYFARFRFGESRRSQVFTPGSGNARLLCCQGVNGISILASEDSIYMFLMIRYRLGVFAKSHY